MTIKLVNQSPTPDEDSTEKDLAQRTVYDNEGYQYVVGKNEHISSNDDGRFATMASNATVNYGADTQQEYAVDIQADNRPTGIGRA